MTRRTIARLIAILLLGYALTFWIVSIDRSDMAHYRSLSHDALLADLAKDHKGNFDVDFGVSVLLLGSVVLLVDAVAVLVEMIINRISPAEHAPE